MAEKNKFEFDFGFEFIEDNIVKAERAKELEDKAQTKVKEMFEMIMPLLQNLKQNPEKPNIYWPNRKEKIDEFISKLHSIVDKG
jgi:hypothetical protein